MRALRVGWLGLAAVAIGVSFAAAQSPGCDGPNNALPVTPCWQALAPQEFARYFLETALMSGSAPTVHSVAAALEAEADEASAAAPVGQLGPLYGLARWGCDNGYSFREFCGGSYYLEKEVDAEYGYVVVFHVVVSSGRWNVFPLDSTFPMTVTSADAGNVQLSVVLSLRQKPSATSAPASYMGALRSQYSGQAAQLMGELNAYCRTYKTSYVQELRSLAGILTQSVPRPSGTRAAELSLTISAPGHLTETTSLALASDSVSFLVVAGTVLDDRGAPVGNAEVSLVGTDRTTRTTSDGAYQLSTFGTGATLAVRRTEITLQRAAVDLSVKSTDVVPVAGIAADGVSRLTLQVTSHGIRPDSITVTEPALGRFERASAAAAPLALDKNGNGTLIYVPPAVLPTTALTDSLTVGSGSAARVVPAAPVSFAVRYIDLDGVSRTSTVSVKVCRPPILLIQSNFAGTASWSKFADHAAKLRLDCLISGEGSTWSQGNVSLSEWAKDLAARISEARAAYEASGIRIGAVDVVAHSLAGLVARSLVESGTPRQDIRKLILVGTPNHGIAWIDQEIGAAAVRWLSAHPTAAGEIREGSTFLRGLNPSSAGEGRTEYVNIVGRRPSLLSASRQGSSTVQDDGIVSAASSHLDGVADVRLDGVVHAPGLLPQIPALTESPDVWSRIVDLLTDVIPDADPDALQYSLRTGKQTSASLDPEAKQWTPLPRFPSSIVSGVAIRTGENGYASLTITRSGQTWGYISLDAKTEIVLRPSSPHLARVEVVSGRVRFRVQESAAEVGNFEVILPPMARNAAWFMTQPDVRALGVGSDFVVAREEASSVIALVGPVIVECSKGTGFSPAQLVEGNTGIRVRIGEPIADEPIPARGWWTAGVWSPPLPFLSFPLPVMVLSLVGLAAALVYHIRARRALANRSGPEGPSSTR